MSWRNRPPRPSDFETVEEYDEAVEAFYDALEAEYEERRYKSKED
jgi:hypothetical protein